MQGEKKYLLTPVRAIRAECIKCMGGYLKEVRLCGSLDCRFWPYRHGKRPTKQMIEELKEYDYNKGNNVD